MWKVPVALSPLGGAAWVGITRLQVRRVALILRSSKASVNTLHPKPEDPTPTKQTSR